MLLNDPRIIDQAVERAIGGDTGKHFSDRIGITDICFDGDRTTAGRDNLVYQHRSGIRLAQVVNPHFGPAPRQHLRAGAANTGRRACHQHPLALEILDTHQCITSPRLTTSACPVMAAAAEEPRNKNVPARSAGVSSSGIA